MLIVLHWTTPEAKQRGVVAMDSCFAVSIAVLFCLQKLICVLKISSLSFENESNEIYSHLSEKEPKGRFFVPD